ncbi:hypothetical protein L2E82_15324 [Cichorium intybus]|uniref:Uncharacterized protein n=1 Tax=Cichorium intybus TaxID=13427 RepID=A0ACB9F1Z0_CICIN|nr:hypothetical protein L2E82_15324 [Cichorium intybus]
MKLNIITVSHLGLSFTPYINTKTPATTPPTESQKPAFTLGFLVLYYNFVSSNQFSVLITLGSGLQFYFRIPIIIPIKLPFFIGQFQ